MLKIAKLIADAGVCSRRDAEKLVQQGVVKVNGVLVNSSAERFEQESAIEINGELLSQKKATELYAIYKPAGCITSKEDPKGRDTVYKYIPKNVGRLVYVGRLDFLSEGLLLFTNNGDLARYLTLPKNKIKRVYKVKVYGDIPKDFIERLSNGVEIDDFKYQQIKVQITAEAFRKNWLKMELHEGKNREIREICNFFNLKIDRLIRIEYAGVKLIGMKPGDFRKLTDEEKWSIEYFFNNNS